MNIAKWIILGVLIGNVIVSFMLPREAWECAAGWFCALMFFLDSMEHLVCKQCCS